MLKYILTGLALVLLLAGCSGSNSATEQIIPTLPLASSTVTPNPSPTDTLTPTFTPTVTDTPTPTLTPTPVIYGPTNFPANIDPLTGLEVPDPANLNRRPVAIKINIVPRTTNRPPWGLAFADIVYDYYHNDGYSRFHAIFYGENANLAGPIRSGRMLDYDLVHMYKSFFVYGSADAKINQRLLNSDFSDRILLEHNSSTCPPTDQNPLCRYEPNTNNFLLGSTSSISAYFDKKGVDNTRQNLDGMTFNPEIQPGGVDGKQLYVRYSGDNYTRWDYDPTTGKYLRFQDNVYDTGQGEDYAPLTERSTDEQLTADTVVVILAGHDYYQEPPAEIVEINLSGTGTAYAFRDGQMYQVQWNRPTTDSVLFLTNPDGTAFPFKPGKTWFQVVNSSTEPNQIDTGVYRFDFRISRQ